MLAILIALAVAGLVAGALLNDLIARASAGRVPASECGCQRRSARAGSIPSVLAVSWVRRRGKCAVCGQRMPTRALIVVVVTSAASVAVAVWIFSEHGPLDQPWETWSVVPVLIAYLYLAAVSIALTTIDLLTHRLPNSIVLPSYLVIGALLALASVLGAQWEALLRGVVGALALFVFYAFLRAVGPGSVGGGDVKLAGVLGAALGFAGWGALVIGALAAFLMAGLVSVALMVAGRIGPRGRIAFGPWMIVGAWIGLFAEDVFARS